MKLNILRLCFIFAPIFRKMGACNSGGIGARHLLEQRCGRGSKRNSTSSISSTSCEPCEFENAPTSANDTSNIEQKQKQQQQKQINSTMMTAACVREQLGAIHVGTNDGQINEPSCTIEQTSHQQQQQQRDQMPANNSSDQTQNNRLTTLEKLKGKRIDQM